MGLGNDLIGDVEQLLAAQVLRRRALYRMVGPTSECWQAEQEIASLCPGTQCLLLPSATTGLALALEALGLPAGTEVLVSPFGWLSNWSCIVRAGLVPRFLPLDESLQLRADDIAERITDRTSAVVVTHLMGRGQQAVAQIAALCLARGVPLLEDIAQSLGVSVEGQRIGTFGLASWCSLNHHKLLSTGDGGFVLSTDPVFFSRLCGIHDHGNTIEHGKRVRTADLSPGLSLRVSELTGAVLRAQLARFNFIRARVDMLHKALSSAFSNEVGSATLAPFAGDIPFTVLFERPSQMTYPSLFDSGWHIAPRVSWLASRFGEEANRDPAIDLTMNRLRAVSAIGAGFVDPYYAIPLGLGMNDGPGDAGRVIDALKSR